MSVIPSTSRDVSILYYTRCISLSNFQNSTNQIWQLCSKVIFWILYSLCTKNATVRNIYNKIEFYQRGKAIRCQISKYFKFSQIYILEHFFQNKTLEILALCWLTHAFDSLLLPIPQLRWLNQRRRHSPTQKLPLENRKRSNSCSRNAKFLKNFQELPVPNFTQGHPQLQPWVHTHRDQGRARKHNTTAQPGWGPSRLLPRHQVAAVIVMETLTLPSRAEMFCYLLPWGSHTSCQYGNLET